MDPDAALALLLRAVRLKWVPRSGWLMRGVPDPESVAEHSWGVALVALVLAEGIGQELDRGKLLAIAVLHDLPEAALTDIPTPALRYFPRDVKLAAEEEALAEMLSPLADGRYVREWWREFEEGSSPEGRLVRDADRLEMLLQAFLYERTRAARVEEFWEGTQDYAFNYPVSRALYEALRRAREG